MKKYKIFNDHIELYFDLYSDLALNKVVELLNIMELNFSNLICNCLYDQDIIDVNFIDDNIIFLFYYSIWISCCKTNCFSC